MSDDARQKELERLLEAQPAPQARAEFRSAVRERFLAGAAAAPPVDTWPDEQPRVPRARSGRNWKPWIALAAAAAIVATLYLSKPAPHHWQVLPGSSATLVRVDGEALPATELERVASALNDARSVSAEGGTLRLRFRDQYAFELPAGARVEFASFGNTGAVDSYSLAAQGAGLRLVTGPGFHGHELHVRSGAANLRVTGTAFAIDNAQGGVCVCGLAGRIALHGKGTPEWPLEAGKQCWFPEDGGAVSWGEAHAAHVGPVRELEAAVGGLWKP